MSLFAPALLDIVYLIIYLPETAKEHREKKGRKHSPWREARQWEEWHGKAAQIEREKQRQK
ncbi:hypothetical protein CC80DRAFT_495552 [Byssothecium circinans]|uniref:Uncharacterized protein n=1 Tax=Byssothecium circinans TaxID=147558 RepID=A0A6A5TJ90_9PLEO|nr:hypothetical protein CC80DRAFT_495552 [Byssothecium circinans]